FLLLRVSIVLYPFSSLHVTRPPPRSTLFPYTTLFRSFKLLNRSRGPAVWSPRAQADKTMYGRWVEHALDAEANVEWLIGKAGRIDRKSTRLNSSHGSISYAVFCLKKKKKKKNEKKQSR